VGEGGDLVRPVPWRVVGASTAKGGFPRAGAENTATQRLLLQRSVFLWFWKSDNFR
jgi:threonine/homoserine efflux transporter RhtA